MAHRNRTAVDDLVSRTSKNAWVVTLDCMVGGNDAAFARVKPIIATWAAKIVHISAVGDGPEGYVLHLSDFFAKANGL